MDPSTHAFRFDCVVERHVYVLAEDDPLRFDVKGLPLRLIEHPIRFGNQVIHLRVLVEQEVACRADRGVLRYPSIYQHLQRKFNAVTFGFVSVSVGMS